jgi:hypothetical protein
MLGKGEKNRISISVNILQVKQKGNGVAHADLIVQDVMGLTMVDGVKTEIKVATF